MIVTPNTAEPILIKFMAPEALALQLMAFEARCDAAGKIILAMKYITALMRKNSIVVKHCVKIKSTKTASAINMAQVAINNK